MSQNLSGSPVLSDTTDASIHGTLLRNSTFISPKSFIENETVLRDCSNISLDRIRGDTTFIQKVQATAQASDTSNLENLFPRESLGKEQVKKKASKASTNNLSDTLSDNSLLTWEHNNISANHLSAEVENVALEEKLNTVKNSLDDSSDKKFYKLGKSLCEVKISFDSPEKKKLNNKTLCKEKSKNRTSEIKSPFKKVSLNFNTDSSVDSVNNCSIDKDILTNCNSSRDDLDLSKSLVNNSTSSIRNSRNLKRKHVEFDLNNSSEKSMNTLDNSTLKSHTKQYEENSLKSFPIGLNANPLKSDVHGKLLDKSLLDSEEKKSSSSFVMKSVKLGKRVRPEGSAINSDNISAHTSGQIQLPWQSSEIIEIKNQSDFDCTGVDLQSSESSNTPVFLENSCPITNDITLTSREDSCAGYLTEGNAVEISKSRIKKPNQKLKKVSIKFNLSNSSEMEHSSIDSENFTKVQKSILRRSSRLSRGLRSSVHWNMDDSVTNKFNEEKSLNSEKISELSDKLTFENPNIVNPSSSEPSHSICTNFTHAKSNESVNTSLNITGLNMSTSTQIGEDEKLPCQILYNSPGENKNTSADQTANIEINISKTTKKISVHLPLVNIDSQVSENMEVLELKEHQSNIILEKNEGETMISDEALYQTDKNNTMQDIEEKSIERNNDKVDKSPCDAISALHNSSLNTSCQNSINSNNIKNNSTMDITGTCTNTEITKESQTSKHDLNTSAADKCPRTNIVANIELHELNLEKSKTKRGSVHFAPDNTCTETINKSEEVMNQYCTQKENITVQEIGENHIGETEGSGKNGQNIEETTEMCNELSQAVILTAQNTSQNTSCQNYINLTSCKNNSTMDLTATDKSTSTEITKEIQVSKCSKSDHSANINLDESNRLKVKRKVSVHFTLDNTDSQTHDTSLNIPSQHSINSTSSRNNSTMDITITNNSTSTEIKEIQSSECSKSELTNIKLNDSNRLKPNRKVSVHFALDNTDSQPHEQRPRKSTLHKSTRGSMCPLPNVLMEMGEEEINKTGKCSKLDLRTIELDHSNRLKSKRKVSVHFAFDNEDSQKDGQKPRKSSLRKSTRVSIGPQCNVLIEMDKDDVNKTGKVLTKDCTLTEDSTVQDTEENTIGENEDNDEKGQQIEEAAELCDTLSQEGLSVAQSASVNTSCKNYINSSSCRNDSAMDFTATNISTSTEITEEIETCGHILHFSNVDDCPNQDLTGNMELDDSNRLKAKKKVSVHFAFDNTDSQIDEQRLRKSLRKSIRASMDPQPNVLLAIDEADVCKTDEVLNKDYSQMEESTAQDTEENSIGGNEEMGQNPKEIKELSDTLPHEDLCVAQSTSVDTSYKNHINSTSCKNNSAMDFTATNISTNTEITKEIETSGHILQLSNGDDRPNQDLTGNMELDDSNRLKAKKKVSVHFAFDNTDSQIDEQRLRKSLRKSIRASMGPQPNVLLEIDEADVNKTDEVLNKDYSQMEESTAQDTEENSIGGNEEMGQNPKEIKELSDTLPHEDLCVAQSTSVDTSYKNHINSTSCKNNSAMDFTATNISTNTEITKEIETSGHILQLSNGDDRPNQDLTGNMELDDSTRLKAKKKVSVHFAFDNTDSQIDEQRLRKSLRKSIRASMGPQPNVLLEIDEADVNKTDEVLNKDYSQMEESTAQDTEENSIGVIEEVGQNPKEIKELSNRLPHEDHSVAQSVSVNTSCKNYINSSSCRNKSAMDFTATNISTSTEITEEIETCGHILHFSNVDDCPNQDLTGNMELDDSNRIKAKKKVSVHFAFDNTDSQIDEQRLRKSIRKSIRASMGPQPNVLLEIDEADVCKTDEVLKKDYTQMEDDTRQYIEEDSIGGKEEVGQNPKQIKELSDRLPHQDLSVAQSTSVDTSCKNYINSTNCRNNSAMDFTATNMSTSTEITEEIETSGHILQLSNGDECREQDLTGNMELDDSNRLKAKKKVSVHFAFDNTDSQIDEQRLRKSLRKSIRASMGPQPNVLLEIDEADVNKTDEVLNKDYSQMEESTAQDTEENSIGVIEEVGQNPKEIKELSNRLPHEDHSVAQSVSVNTSCKNYINSSSCRNKSAMDFTATNISTSTEITEEIETCGHILHFSNVDDCPNQDLTGNMELDDSNRIKAKKKVSVHFAFDNTDSQIDEQRLRKSIRKSIRASMGPQPNVLLEIDEADVCKTDEVLKKDYTQMEDDTRQYIEEDSIGGKEEVGQNPKQIKELSDRLPHQDLSVAQSTSVDTSCKNYINSTNCRNNSAMDFTATNMSTSTEITEEIETSGHILQLSNGDECREQDLTGNMELDDSNRLKAKKKVSVHFAFDNTDSQIDEQRLRKSLRKSIRASMGPQPNVLLEIDEADVNKTDEVLNKDYSQMEESTAQDTEENSIKVLEEVGQNPKQIKELSDRLPHEDLSVTQSTSADTSCKNYINSTNCRNNSAMDFTATNMSTSTEITEEIETSGHILQLSNGYDRREQDLTGNMELDDSNRLKAKKKVSVHFAFDNTDSQIDEQRLRKSLRKSIRASMGPQPNVLLEIDEADVNKTDEVLNKDYSQMEESTAQDTEEKSIGGNEEMGQNPKEIKELSDTLPHEDLSVAQSTSVDTSYKNHINSTSCKNNSAMDFTATNISTSTEITEEIETSGHILQLSNGDDHREQDLTGNMELDNTNSLKARKKVSVHFAFDNTDSQIDEQRLRKSLRKSIRASMGPQHNVLLEVDEADVNKTDEVRNKVYSQVEESTAQDTEENSIGVIEEMGQNPKEIKELSDSLPHEDLSVAQSTSVDTSCKNNINSTNCKNNSAMDFTATNMSTSTEITEEIETSGHILQLSNGDDRPNQDLTGNMELDDSTRLKAKKKVSVHFAFDNTDSQIDEQRLRKSLRKSIRASMGPQPNVLLEIDEADVNKTDEVLNKDCSEMEESTAQDTEENSIGVIEELGQNPKEIKELSNRLPHEDHSVAQSVSVNTSCKNYINSSSCRNKSAMDFTATNISTSTEITEEIETCGHILQLSNGDDHREQDLTGNMELDNTNSPKARKKVSVHFAFDNTDSQIDEQRLRKSIRKSIRASMGPQPNVLLEIDEADVNKTDEVLNKDYSQMEESTAQDTEENSIGVLEEMGQNPKEIKELSDRLPHEDLSVAQSTSVDTSCKNYINSTNCRNNSAMDFTATNMSTSTEITEEIETSGHILQLSNGDDRREQDLTGNMELDDSNRLKAKKKVSVHFAFDNTDSQIDEQRLRKSLRKSIRASMGPQPNVLLEIDEADVNKTDEVLNKDYSQMEESTAQDTEEKSIGGNEEMGQNPKEIKELSNTLPHEDLCVPQSTSVDTSYKNHINSTSCKNNSAMDFTATNISTSTEITEEIETSGHILQLSNGDECREQDLTGNMELDDSNRLKAKKKVSVHFAFDNTDSQIDEQRLRKSLRKSIRPSMGPQPNVLLEIDEADVNKTDEVLNKDYSQMEESTAQDTEENSIGVIEEMGQNPKEIKELSDRLPHEDLSVAQSTSVDTSYKNHINSTSYGNNSAMDFTATNMSTSAEITEEIETSGHILHLSNVDDCPNQDLTGNMELDDSNRLKAKKKVSVHFAFDNTDSQIDEQRLRKSLRKSIRASMGPQPNVLLEIDEADVNKTDEVLNKDYSQMEESTAQDTEENSIGGNEEMGQNPKEIKELSDTLPHEDLCVAQSTSVDTSYKNHINSTSCKNNSAMDFTATNISTSTEITEEIETSGHILQLSNGDDHREQDLTGNMELDDSNSLKARKKVSVHFAFDNTDSQIDEQRLRKSLRKSIRASMGPQPNVLLEIDEADVDKTDEVLNKDYSQIEESTAQDTEENSIGVIEEMGQNPKEIKELSDRLPHEDLSVAQSTSVDTSCKNYINSTSYGNNSAMDFTATNMSTSTEITEEIETSGHILNLSNVDDCPNQDLTGNMELDDSNRLKAKKKVSVHFAFDNTYSQIDEQRLRKSLRKSIRASMGTQPNVLLEIDEADVNETDEVLNKDYSQMEESTAQDTEENSIGGIEEMEENPKEIKELSDRLPHEDLSVAQSTSVDTSCKNYINSTNCRNNSAMDFTATNLSTSAEITEEIETSRHILQLSNVDDRREQDLTGNAVLDYSSRLKAKKKVSVHFAFDNTDSQTIDQKPPKSSLRKSIGVSRCSQPNILMAVDEDDANKTDESAVLNKDCTQRENNSGQDIEDNSIGENEEKGKNSEGITKLSGTLAHRAVSAALSTSLNSSCENYIKSTSCRNNSTMDMEGTNMSTSTEVTEEIQTSGHILHLSNVDDCPNQDLTGNLELDDSNRRKAKRKVSVHFALDKTDSQTHDMSLNSSSQSSVNSASSRNNSTMGITVTNNSTSTEISKEIQGSECSTSDLTNIELNDSNRLKSKRKVSVPFAFDNRDSQTDEQRPEKTTLCKDNFEVKRRLESREEMASNATETITTEQSDNNLVMYRNNNRETILEENNFKNKDVSDRDTSEEITFNSCLEFSTGVLSSTRFAEITEHHSYNFQNNSEQHRHNSTKTIIAIEDQHKVLKNKRLSVHLGFDTSCSSEIHTSSDSSSTSSLDGTYKSDHSVKNIYTKNIDAESSYISESQNMSKERNVKGLKEKKCSVEFIQENVITERGGNFGEIEDVKSDLPTTEISLNSVGSQSESSKNYSNEPVERFIQTSTSITNCSRNESGKVTEDTIENYNTFSLIKQVSEEESIFNAHNLLEIKGSSLSTSLSLNEEDLSYSEASTDIATESLTCNSDGKKPKSSQHNEGTVEQCIQNSDMLFSGQPTMENVKCNISAQASIDSNFTESEHETDVNNDNALGILSKKTPPSDSAVSENTNTIKSDFLAEKSLKKKNSISDGNESNKGETFFSKTSMESQFFNSSDSSQELGFFNNKNTKVKVTPYNVSVHVGIDSTCQTLENENPRGKALSGSVVSCDSLQVQPSIMLTKSELSKTSDKYEVSAITEKSGHREMGPRTVSVNLGFDTTSLGYENTLDSSVSERYISSSMPTTSQKKLDACKTTVAEEENKQKVSGFDTAHTSKINESPHSREMGQNGVIRSDPEISATASAFESDNLNEESIKKIKASRNVSVHFGFDTTILPSELQKTVAKESLENYPSNDSRSAPTSVLIPATEFSKNSDNLKTDDFNKKIIENNRLVPRKVSVHSGSDTTILLPEQGNTEPIDILENNNQSNSTGEVPLSTIISEKEFPETTVVSTTNTLNEEAIEKVMGTRNVSVHIGFDTTTFLSQQENTVAKEILKNNSGNIIRDVLSTTSEIEFSKIGASFKRTDSYEETVKNKNKSPREVSVHLGFDTTTLPLEQENSKPQDVVENTLNYSETKVTLSPIISEKGFPGTTTDLTTSNLNEETRNRKVIAPRNVSVHFGFDSTTFPSQQENTNETLEGNSIEFSKVGASLKTADLCEETFKNKNKRPRDVSVHLGFDTTTPPLEQENAKPEDILENKPNHTETIAALSIINSDKKFPETTTASATDNLNEEANKEIMDTQNVSGCIGFDTTTPPLEQENAIPEGILENQNYRETGAPLSTPISVSVFSDATPTLATEKLNVESTKKAMTTRNVSVHIGFDSTIFPSQQESTKETVEKNLSNIQRDVQAATLVSETEFSETCASLKTADLHKHSFKNNNNVPREVSVHIGFDTTAPPLEEENTETKEIVDNNPNYSVTEPSLSKVISETRFSDTRTALTTGKLYEESIMVKAARNVSVDMCCVTATLLSQQESTVAKETLENKPKNLVNDNPLPILISETEFGKTAASSKASDLHEDTFKNNEKGLGEASICSDTTIQSQEQENTENKRILEHNNLSKSEKEAPLFTIHPEPGFCETATLLTSDYKHEESIGVSKQNVSVHLSSDTMLPSHQKNFAGKDIHESSPSYTANNSLASATMREPRFSLISDDLKSYDLKKESEKNMITKKSLNIDFDSTLGQSRVENSSLKGDLEYIPRQKSFGSGINGPIEEKDAPTKMSAFSNESSIPVGNADLMLSGTKNISPPDIENETHILLNEHKDVNKCDEKNNCIKTNTSNAMPFPNSSESEKSSTLLKVITNDKEHVRNLSTDQEEPTFPLDSVGKLSSDSSLPFRLSLGSLTDENSNHSNSSHSLAKELVNEDIDCVRQANNFEESPQFSECLLEPEKVDIMQVSENNDSLVLEDVLPNNQTRLDDNISDIVSPTVTLCKGNNLSKVKKVSLIAKETLKVKTCNASFTESIREDLLLKKESDEAFKRTPTNVSNKNTNLNSDGEFNLSNKSNSVNKRVTRSSSACSQDEPSKLNYVKGLHLDQDISHETINAENSEINCALAKTAEKVSSGESNEEFTTVKLITDDDLCLRKSCGNDLLSTSHDPFLPAAHGSGKNITNEDISYVIGTSRISMSNETLEISGRCNEVADNKYVFDISLASNPNLENELVEKHSLHISNTSSKNNRTVCSRKRSKEGLHKLPKSQNSDILKTEYTNDSKGNRYNLRKSNNKSTSVNTDSEKHLKRKSVTFADTVCKSVSPDKSEDEGPPQKKNRECVENKPALNTSSLGSLINCEDRGEGKKNFPVSDHNFVFPQEPQYKRTDRVQVSNYKRSRSPEEKQSTSSDNSNNYSKRKKVGDDKTINDLSNDSVDVSEIPRDRTVAPRKIIYHSTPINPVFERNTKGRPRKGSRGNSSKNNTDKIIQVSKSIFGSLSDGMSPVVVKNKSSDLSSSYSLGGKSGNKLKTTSASNRTSDSRDIYSEKSLFSIPRSSKNEYSSSTFSRVSSQVPTKSVRFRQELKFRDFSSKTDSSKDTCSDKKYTSRFTDLSGSMLSTLSNSVQVSRLSDSFKKVCFRDNSSHIENSNSYNKDQSQYNVSVSSISTLVHQSEPRRYWRAHVKSPRGSKKQTDSVYSDVQNSTISSIAMQTVDSEMPTLTSEFLYRLTKGVSGKNVFGKDGSKHNERDILGQPMYSTDKQRKQYTSQKFKFPEKWVSLELFKFFNEKLKPNFSEQATVMSEDLIGHFCVMVNTAKYLEQVRDIDTLVFRNLLYKYNICNNYLEYYTLISKYTPFDFQRKFFRLGGYFSCGSGGIPMNSKMKISDPILNELEMMEVSLC